MSKEFTTQERKKEFDTIFKEKILPFFENYDFVRHTKTSKRLIKALDRDLTVYIFLEYKNLFGCYDITIAYFDAEIGTMENDDYLAIAKIKTPSFSGNNKEKLNLSVDIWLKELQSSILPFLEKHSTHNAIKQEPNLFDIPKSREKDIFKLLERKSTN